MHSFIYFGLIPIDHDIFTTNYTWVQSVSRQTGSLFIHVPPRFRVTYGRPWPSYIEFESRLLQWRHNGRDGVSNQQPHHCLLKRLFTRRSKKTSKFRVTGFCAGNSPLTGELPAQMVSNAENVSILWRHHASCGLATSHPPQCGHNFVVRCFIVAIFTPLSHWYN